ncbi:hypothetical protein BGX27_001955 [Mortierella sp. AM989]|nr:hypothetical protein BGX27_001955 [Mortierella sp. AM989]
MADKDISKSARRVSKLDNAVGEHQLKKNLHQLGNDDGRESVQHVDSGSDSVSGLKENTQNSDEIESRASGSDSQDFSNKRAKSSTQQNEQSSRSSKKKKVMCATEEPWNALTRSLTRVINCEKGVKFPQKLSSMDPLRAELFDHAVNMLKEYQGQSEQQKDISVVKDAQVAMSCVLNTLSKRACDHFDNYNNGSILEEAKELSLVEGFTEHPCQRIMKNYIPILEEADVEDFLSNLKTDWGLLQSRKSKPPLPSQLLEDKVIEILILLCKFITHPPFGAAIPSEMDCMHIWVSIFSVLTDKVTLHTGEKALGASKLMRQLQTSEYGDVSDAGRKADCLFMFQDIELSNIEFKCDNISPREIAIQNRKNIRLARCIQELHVAIGVSSPSVHVADVAGFVGMFYQAMPMGEIAIAGRTAPETVHLPRNKGDLLNFLEDSSLAIIWNFIDSLEKQAPKLRTAKERTESTKKKEKFVQSIARPRDTTPPPPAVRLFSNNVTLSPTKKRGLSSIERGP